MTFSKLTAVFSLLLIVSSCSRADHSSKLRLQMPPHPNVSAKAINTTLNDPPPFCYFVNVLSGGIDRVAKPCAPDAGLSSTMSPPGSTIEMTVPKGSGREVQLFGYLPATGESCTSNITLQTAEVTRLFLMATVSNVDMSGAETVVSMIAAFPGISQHFAATSGMPSSCSANYAPPSGGEAVTQGLVLRGARYQSIGQIGSGSKPQSLIGSRFKISGETKHEIH